MDWRTSISSALASFCQRLCGIALLQVSDACQRGVALAKTVFCVGFPVERGVRLRAVHVREFLEFCGSLFVAIFVQVFAAVVVQFLDSIHLFLGTVAGFLLTFTSLLFSVAFLLLAVAFFLFFILVVLRVLQRFHSLRKAGPEAHGLAWRQAQVAAQQWRAKP